MFFSNATGTTIEEQEQTVSTMNRNIAVPVVAAYLLTRNARPCGNHETHFWKTS